MAWPIIKTICEAKDPYGNEVEDLTGSVHDGGDWESLRYTSTVVAENNDSSRAKGRDMGARGKDDR